MVAIILSRYNLRFYWHASIFNYAAVFQYMLGVQSFVIV